MDRKRYTKCGTAMDSYVIDCPSIKSIFAVIIQIDGYLIEEGSFKIKGYDSLL